MKKLVAKAEENTTATMKSGATETVIKEGIPLEADAKHKTAKRPSKVPQTVVGMSKGITQNMGDFNSFRADCWLTTTVEKGETIEEAYLRIEEIIDRTLVAISD